MGKSSSSSSSSSSFQKPQAFLKKAINHDEEEEPVEMSTFDLNNGPECESENSEGELLVRVQKPRKQKRVSAPVFFSPSFSCLRHPFCLSTGILCLLFLLLFVVGVTALLFVPEQTAARTTIERVWERTKPFFSSPSPSISFSSSSSPTSLFSSLADAVLNENHEARVVIVTVSPSQQAEEAVVQRRQPETTEQEKEVQSETQSPSVIPTHAPLLPSTRTPSSSPTTVPSPRLTTVPSLLSTTVPSNKPTITTVPLPFTAGVPSLAPSTHVPALAVVNGSLFGPEREAHWRQLRLQRTNHSKSLTANGSTSREHWDATRIELCDKQDNETTKLFPLDSHILIKQQERLTKIMEAKNWTFRNMSSNRGDNNQKLGFNITVVKKEFEMMVLGLLEYYEGTTDHLETMVRPFRGSRGFNQYFDKLVDLLASKFVRGSETHPVRFNVGVEGTSVISGQDNCFHFAYPPMLERALKPIMSLAGVDFSTKGTGQNGDSTCVSQRLVCSDSIFDGDEVDVIQTGYFFVDLPPQWEIEIYSRRWLRKGVLLWNLYPFDDLANAYEGHMMSGVYPDSTALASWGATAPNSTNPWPWWPNEGGNPQWRRQTSPYCHSKTRDGQMVDFSGVFMQNWHPGPIGFQLIMDPFLYIVAQAAIEALTRIEQELKATRNLDALRTKWIFPRPSPVLPPVHTVDCNTSASHHLCHNETGRQWGITCITGLAPKWKLHTNISEWLVPRNATPNVTQVPSTINYLRYKWRSCEQHNPSCSYSDHAAPFRCDEHPDTFYIAVGQGGPVTFRLPAMQKGDVWICQFNMQVSYQHFSNSVDAIWINSRPLPNLALNATSLQYGCVLIAVDLPEKAEGGFLTLLMNRHVDIAGILTM